MMASILILLSSLLLHPAQESLAELQWNEETQRLEVALRLSIADEQHLLRSDSQTKPASLINDSAAFEKAALTVLRKRMRFSADGEIKTGTLADTIASRYRWIGRQSEGGHVWWFFEYAAPQSELVYLRCSLFEKPARRDGEIPHPTAHDHVHASPISTFLLLPRTTPEGKTTQPEKARPKSFTTTVDRPVARIPWSA